MKGKESPYYHWNQLIVPVRMWPPHKGNVKIGNKEVKWYNLFK